MIDVFDAIGNMDMEKQVATLKVLFGQWAIQGAAKLTGNLGSFTDALAMVNDPSLYKGSMEREFIIKASTSEAVDTMMANAFRALKIDVGTAFLPAKKEMSVALIDFMNQLRDMPELGEIAQTLASLFSQGVTWAGEELENALPTIQQALNYLLDHGPQVVGVLKSLAGAFLAMKFAPGITGLLGGAGNLLLGAKSGAGSYATRTGGLAGMLSGLWKGGGRAAGQAGGLLSAFGGAAQGNGFLRTLSATASSLLSGNGIAGTTGLLAAGAGIPGLLNGFQGVGGVIRNSIAGSGIGQYFGGIVSSLGNLGNTKIGSGILGGLKATGLTGLVNGGLGAVRSGAGWVAGKAGGLAQGAMGLAGRVAGSAPVQAIGGMMGNVGSFMSAGMGALGSMWGPMASGFGGLLSGALPIVGVISSIIAVVSLLGDHLEDIRGIVGNVFGDAGLAVFDTFIGGLKRVARQVSTEIADAIAASPVPGVVKLYVLMDGGTIAGEEIKEKVLAACSADDVRPLTDFVSVEDPEETPYNVRFTYYTPRNASISAAELEAAVRRKAEEYTAWQCAKLGRDINPSRLISMLMETGIKRVDVAEPVFTKLRDGNGTTVPQVASLGSMTIISGGYEDE